jgi:hypothetical protein
MKNKIIKIFELVVDFFIRDRRAKPKAPTKK